MWGYVIILLAVVIILKIMDTKTAKKPGTKKVKETKITEYRGHYQAKYLLTRNEWYEYRKLKKYADAYGLQICPKVRLLDIVEPRSGDAHYMAYMGKVQSKHVDFVICDQDLHIKGIIELDDNSHDRPDRQERDSFVDEILTDVGYKVIHTRSITENTMEAFTRASIKEFPQINIDLRTEEEKELAKQIHIEHSEQTYEEWKAEREAQINNEHPEK